MEVKKFRKGAKGQDVDAAGAKKPRMAVKRPATAAMVVKSDEAYLDASEAKKARRAPKWAVTVAGIPKASLRDMHILHVLQSKAPCVKRLAMW